MEIIKKLKSNIIKLYIYRFLDNFWLDRAIWIIYLLGRGFDILTIGFAETILHLSILVFEIPTGSIADIFGRKWSLVIGSLLNIIAILMMVLAQNPLVLMISFSLYGISLTFRSGADESLLYDSCKEEGLEEKFKSISGNLTSVFYLATIIAQALGGLIANYSFGVLYALRAGTMLVAAIWITSAMEIETESRGKDNKTKKIGDLIDQVKKSLRTIWETEKLLPLSIFYSIFFAVHNIFTILGQQFYNTVGVGTEYIGFIYSAAMLVSIFGAKWAAKIDDYFGKNLCIRTSVIIFGFLVFAWVLLPYPYNIIFFVLLNFHKAILTPIFSYEINRLIPSKERATILSINGAIFSFIQTVGFPVAGYYINHYSIINVFIVINIITILALVTLYLPVFSNSQRSRI